MSTGLLLASGAAIGLSISIAFIVLAPAASDYGDRVYRARPLSRTLVALAVALVAAAALAFVFLDALAGLLTAIVAVESGVGAALASHRERSH